MEIILLQDIGNLGNKNDVVKVKDGYGRNYLIPQKMAIVANKGNLKMREELVKVEARREEKMRSQLQVIIDKLKNVNIRIGAKVGTTEKIFGSVTTHHLAEEILSQTGVKLDRRKIHIEEEVKTLGTYSAVVDLFHDVKINVQFEVIAE